MFKFTLKTVCLILIAIFVVFLDSCSIYKRKHLSGYSIQKSSRKQNVDSQQLWSNSVELSTNEYSTSTEGNGLVGEKKPENLTPMENENYGWYFENSKIDGNSFPKIQSRVKLRKEKDCDEIILRNGKSINGKIVEIGLQEIKYKNCDNLNGPLISVEKDDAFMVKYSNGTSQVFEENATKKNFQSINGARTEPMAIFSLVLSVLGLLFGLFIFGIVGLIFCFFGIVLGIASLIRISNSPGKFTGKGFAIGGIISGVLFFVSLMALFIILLSFF
jgi:hypothetical protein